MVGAKKILLQALAPSWRLPPFPLPGGRGVDKICAILNFPGGFVVFLSSLTSEERVSKQLKQVPSILGRITLLIPTTLKKCAKQKNIPKKQTQQKLVSYDLQIVIENTQTQR